MEKEGLTTEQVNDVMNKKSGFLGVSGVSSDARDLSTAIAEGPEGAHYERAKLAINILVHQIKKFIGSYAAVMNGVDAIVFTAGIGENNSALRALVCENMEYLGVEFDKEANDKARGVTMKISTDSSKVDVYVIPTNEELVIAKDTAAIVAAL